MGCSRDDSKVTRAFIDERVRMKAALADVSDNIRMHVNGLHGIIDLNEKARAYYCTIYSFTSQKEKKERTNRQTARPRFLDLFPSVVVVVVVVELLLTILDSTTTTFFSPLVLPTSSFSHSLNYLHSKVGSSAILTPPSLTFHTFPASHFPLPPPFAAVD
ncbi:hypothetical protein DFJ77DRAFT_306408 [Powellomyces hirtus]|nr:hypothetical protein DFJ77DRAFT_306408 [Powellomyces hirtus]